MEYEQNKLMFLQEMADAMNENLFSAKKLDSENKGTGVNQILAFFDHRLGSNFDNIKFLCTRVNMMLDFQYELVVINACGELSPFVSVKKKSFSYEDVEILSHGVG